VGVLDTGAAVVGGETVSFYVMPFYAKTLRQLIQGRIPPEGVLKLFGQLLDGVEAAHMFGVCHRDLKPENVLFDDDTHQLVVADFGAAEFVADELYTVIETRPKERIGNFRYSAPEQRTPGGKVDHRSDIYALGLILNEMFTGEVPEGTDHRQIASVSAAHGYLDALVEIMRRQNPEARPESIARVKADIIAKGNEFIALQRLNDLKNAVIPVGAPDDPLLTTPPAVIDLDYDGENLKFVIAPNPSDKWLQVFVQPRSSYYQIQGQGPASVRFERGSAVLRVPPHAVESAVRIFKEWVFIANRAFPNVVQSEARKREADERERLRLKVEAEEKRLEAVRRAKAALGG
jgi:serine/threonine protein kinase